MGVQKYREYRASQHGKKQVEQINIDIYNCFFHYCELIGSTSLQEFQQNNHESWISNNSGGESHANHVKQDRCPTAMLRKFKRHETMNSIRLEQTAKIHTEANDVKTTDSIRTAETDFASDLPLPRCRSRKLPTTRRS